VFLNLKLLIKTSLTPRSKRYLSRMSDKTFANPNPLYLGKTCNQEYRYSLSCLDIAAKAII
jgi:hypothetical protein